MTLTEQWKKGELKDGWYYTQVGGFEEVSPDLYDKDDNSWLCDSDKDLHPLEVLAPVPSYEELEELKIDNHNLNAWIKNFQPKYKEMEKENAQLIKFLEEFNALDVAKENQQLKELLKEYKKQLSEIKDAYIDLTTQDEYGSYYIDEAKLFVEIVGKTIKDYDELELKQYEVLK